MSKQNSQDEELVTCLKELHLPAMRGGYQELADSARREGLRYEAYLLEVVQRGMPGAAAASDGAAAPGVAVAGGQEPGRL